MTKELDFHKIGDRWYADVPGWKGSLDDLEMVMGADTLLDAITNNGRFARIQLSTEQTYGSIHAEFKESVYDGSTYTIEGVPEVSEIWLCKVNDFFWKEITGSDSIPADIYLILISSI